MASVGRSHDESSAGWGKSRPNPTDRAEIGTKRSLLTDGAGIPRAIVVTGANRPDFQLAQETLEAIVVTRSTPTADAPHGLCLDAGYDYAVIYDLLAAQGYTEHIRSAAGELKVKDTEKRARRWVVERTDSWLDRYHALLIRWCKQAAWGR